MGVILFHYAKNPCRIKIMNNTSTIQTNIYIYIYIKERGLIIYLFK